VLYNVIRYNMLLLVVFMNELFVVDVVSMDLMGFWEDHKSCVGCVWK
jgi:hypothetical protein